MHSANNILKEALSLNSIEKAYLIDELFQNLDKNDIEIEKL